VPNAVDAVVNLGPATTAGLSLSVLASNFTIGSLNDNSTQTYSIIGSGHGLIMQASSGNATIIMGNTGSLTLSSAALILNSDLNVQTTSGSTGSLTKPGGALGFITSNNHNIYFTGSGTGKFNLSQNFTGTGSVTQSSGGTLTLGGTINSYSGGTILNSGTLNINSASAIGTGAFTISGGVIDNASAAAITLSNNNAQNWNGDFTFIGTQGLNLGTGAVTMNASRIVTVSGNVLTVGGSIGDGGSGFSLTKNGAGTLVLSAANTYSGGTTVNAGTLNINTDAALGAAPGSATAAAIILNGGTLQVANDLSLNSNRGIALGNATTTGSGTIDTQSFVMTYGGVIADNGGNGGLNKSGTGTLILSGANTYSGATIVNAGVLEVDGSLAAASAVSVNSGGTLSGIGTVGGAMTTNAGSSISPGTAGTGTLTVGSLIATGATTIKITLSNTDNTTLNAITVTGALTNSGGSIQFDFSGTGFFDGLDVSEPNVYTLLSFGSNSGFSTSDFSYINLATGLHGSFSLTGGNLQFDVVPEPAVWSLGAGAAGLGLAALKRQRLRSAV